MGILAFLLSLVAFIYAIVSKSSSKSFEERVANHIKFLENKIRQLELKIEEEKTTVQPTKTDKTKEEYLQKFQPQESPIAEPIKTEQEKPIAETIAHLVPVSPIEDDVNKFQPQEEKLSEAEPTINQDNINLVNATPLTEEQGFYTYENDTTEIEPKKEFGTHKSPSQPKIPSSTPTPSSDFWTKLEKQFVENWTGILGALIMVAGVVFLGVYAAIKLSAFYRFLLINSFAGVLTGIFFYLRKFEKWQKFGLWLRSSAGAIFLFACLGSVIVPGLQWVSNPYYGMLLLVAGIVINLYLGFVGGNQAFASLHVSLSLVSLCILPQSTPVLIIAAAVSLFGIALTYREKWDYHLLLTVSSFFAYHLFWYFQQTEFTLDTKLVGIITVLLISITVALVHYRKVYQTKTFDTVPFLVHLINWLYFGIGLFMHSTGNKISTLFITVGAIAAFFLARRAKKLEIRWLYVTDTLLAQVAALIALITLSKWGFNEMVIISCIFMEAMIFMFVMIKEKEPLLYKIALIALNIVGNILLLDGLRLLHTTDISSIYLNASLLLGCFIAGIGFHFYNFKHNDIDTPDINNTTIPASNKQLKTPFNSFIIGALFLLAYLYMHQFVWATGVFIVIAILLLLLRNKLQSLELGITSIVVVIGVHIINWFTCTATDELMLLAHFAPPLLLSLFAIKWSYIEAIKKYINQPGIYLFALQMGIGGYFIFNPISPLITGVYWLILSIIALEVSNVVATKFKDALPYKNQADRFLLQSGYVFIAAFLIRHLMINLQAEQYIGGIIKVRILIELFALFIFCYWLTAKNKGAQTYRSWNNLHPLFLELILVFSTLSIALEVSAFWQPIIWIGLAFITGLIGLKNQQFSRLRFYSLVLYWVTAFQVSFLTSAYITPSMAWYDQASVAGLVSIVFQFLFLLFFYKKCDLSTISLPASMSWLKGTMESLNKSRNWMLFYPLVICVAIFLFWSFDKSVLTLLWVVECFVVFILSIFLKEKHFRYVSLIALMVCIIRLVFFDLSQASTLTRALVFFGVGIIMLIMNFVYNKYKDRFSNE